MTEENQQQRLKSELETTLKRISRDKSIRMTLGENLRKLGLANKNNRTQSRYELTQEGYEYLESIPERDRMS